MAADRRRHPAGRRGRTVRARTTLAATLIVGLTLLVGGTAMLTLLRRSLVQNIEDVADLRADDIAALARSGTLPRTLTLEDDAVGQVVDAEGRIVAATTNVGRDAPVDDRRPTSAEPVFRTMDRLTGVAGSYRVLAQRADSPDGPVTVFVAVSLEPVEDILVVVRTSLLIGAPSLVALVATLTWLTVGRALQPVEAIRSQVAGLSSNDLHHRVSVPSADDEISRLASTMNAMLDRLETTAQQQRRFVADASHELQTPLAAVRADLEVALAYPDAAPWPDTARNLLDANRRMERLVADLLFIARSDEGLPPADPAPVDLHEVVLDEAARLTTANRVRIDVSRVTSAFVRGRRAELSRAVRNLFDNAEHHATTTITVALGHGDGAVTLVVEDDGPGVPPEHRERIFDRFTRLDDARSRNSGGSGLGLAIVKEIVERHQGRVTVEGGDIGARFVVALPPD